MAIFAISDLHLSLNSDKPMDIFKGWENYVSRLEKNWRAIVSDDDTVVIPGDISWEMKIEDTVKDFSFIHSLPGKKIIFKGNHDLWWNSLKKMNEHLETNGFDSITIVNNGAVRVGEYAVCGTRGWAIDESGTDSKLIKREALRLEATIKEAEKLGGEILVFLHYPVVFEDNVCTELVDVLKAHGIKKVYYGHLHGKKSHLSRCTEYDGISFYLVSCDFLEFTPLLIR
ncbi:MAG: metallophosphoesterase [Clostridia bacterium]|nr:metallophosphoesterase [Clostridia bacterium]